MMITIITNQLMITGKSGLFDSQLSTEVKYTALDGIYFPPTVSFSKEVGLTISIKEMRHVCVRRQRQIQIHQFLFGQGKYIYQITTFGGGRGGGGTNW